MSEYVRTVYGNGLRIVLVSEGEYVRPIHAGSTNELRPKSARVSLKTGKRKARPHIPKADVVIGPDGRGKQYQ